MSRTSSRIFLSPVCSRLCITNAYHILKRLDNDIGQFDRSVFQYQLITLKESVNQWFGQTMKTRPEMPSSRDIKYAFPDTPPKTFRSLQKFHTALLCLTMLAEFRQKVLKKSLGEVNAQIHKYAAHMSDPQKSRAARLALDQLNMLKSEFRSKLDQATSDIALLHNSNYLILRAVLRGAGRADLVAEVETKPPKPGSNLLHEPGWLNEVAIAEALADQGKAVFLTFGTPFDGPAGDAVVVDRPLRRLTWTQAPWASFTLTHLKQSGI